ncbi:MAG TPA: hypothetical protein VIP09_05435 [Dehalococcoidia bacterium]|jgi:hypothetical protein
MTHLLSTSPATIVVWAGRRSPDIQRAASGPARRAERKELLYWGLLLGLAAGFITDMVVTAGGA